MIFLGADHNGNELKNEISKYLVKSGYEVSDQGDTKLDLNDDFPVFASRVVNALKSSSSDNNYGILICGSGQGMYIAANRYKGIRAALCWNVVEARAARNDDNCNVLCLSARSTSPKEAENIINAWLNTPYAAAPRFNRRIKELDDLV